MDALLLAAGLGTRLRPLTDVLPKCLMPVQGRPLLGIWLEMLKQGGVDRVFINLHYLSPLVRAYVENSPYRQQVTFLDEPELLGTAGTLNRFRNEFSDTLLLAHADNLTLFDVTAFIRAFEQRTPDCAMTMMTFETDQPQSCGIVSLDEAGTVVAFTEKPQAYIGNLANGAVYVMDFSVIRKVLDADPQITDFSTQILPEFVGRMNSYHNGVYHRDIGTVAAIGNAQLEIESVAMAGPLLAQVDSYWAPTPERRLMAEKFRETLALTDLSQEVVGRLMLG
ncbi:nucleotidyltransferase family protein [Sneathiella sp.]|jgi:mannose-1-phosphate guanylyltransferase|uniref:nucleotidyltransferase family protein n=1 Tax=Sneathiella sp. TaxID=1964365 RepID=UPI0039E67648